MGDAYQMSNTQMEGGCSKFGVHLSTPIMGGDSGLQSLCEVFAWWMLGRLWMMLGWCFVVVGLVSVGVMVQGVDRVANMVFLVVVC